MPLPDVMVLSGLGALPAGGPGKDVGLASSHPAGLSQASAGSGETAPVEGSDSDEPSEAPGPGTVLFLDNLPFASLLAPASKPKGGPVAPPVGVRPMPPMPGALHAPGLGVLPRSGLIPDGAVTARPVQHPPLIQGRSMPQMPQMPQTAGQAKGRRPVIQMRMVPGKAVASASVGPRPAAPVLSTFAAAPWLAGLEPDPAATPLRAMPQGAPGAPPALPGEPPPVLNPPTGLVQGADAAAGAGEGGSAGARAASAPAVTASTLSSEPGLVEARVRFQPPVAPVPERLKVRVHDGEHALRIAVQKDADGYAVELRAPREVVPELRAMEGQIDRALGDESDGGLASFDAQAEDSFPDHDPADADNSSDGRGATTAPPESDDRGLGAILNRKA